MDADALRQEIERLKLQLQRVQRVANIATWEIHVPGNRSEWSDDLYRLLGIAPQSVPAGTETFRAYVHPDDLERLRRVREDAMRGDPLPSFDHRIVRADGEVRYVRQRADIVRDQDGNPRVLYGTIQDITEDKLTERKLTERARQQAMVAALGQKALEESSLQSLQNSALNAIAQTFDITHCAVMELTPDRDAFELVAGIGWKREPAANLRINAGRDSQAGYTLLCMEPVIVRDLDAETRFTASPLLRDNGIVSGITTVIGSDRQPWGVLGVFSTEQREFTLDDVNFVQSVANVIAEATRRAVDRERVRESEERFRIIAKATVDTVWDWNLRTDEVSWNEGMRKVFGYASSDLEPDSRSFRRRIHPDDRERVLDSIDELLKGNATSWRADYRFLRQDGSFADVKVRGFVIRDERLNALRVVGSMDDVTLRKEYELKLERQAALLDKAQDAIIVRDMDHRVTYWNRSAERLYGWTAEEACGKRLDELLHEDPARFADASSELLETGEWSGECEQRSKSGDKLVCETAWSLLTDHEGNPEAVMAINTDISERLTLEAQLRQAQRLESIGQLTGGVAHDFNNLLTVILGNAELMLDKLPEGERMHKLASMTRTAARRGAELTHRLLAFARRQALAPIAFDVNRLVVEAEPLLQRALPETVDFEFVPGHDLWNAFADASQLESVILNLVLNARDAMPDGGKLTIETANVHLDEDYAAQNSEVGPGCYVMLAVSDTGTGIAPENLPRVFDPFFTTKEKGKGTGLGLSMAYGFAKQSRGHIKIYSEPGQGTTVKVYVPRSTKANHAVEVEASSETDLGGTERILVVEDNDLVREHAERQLAEFGYDVVTASNGRRAMEIIKNDEGIDLLFTDVIMSGGMSGRELAEQARRTRPQLKVLYTSGYTENAIVHHGRLDEGVQLLQKPYRRVDLARKVRLVLESTPDGSRPGANR